MSKQLITENRPWGSFTVFDEKDNHKLKRLIVNPHSKLSLQLHHLRSEHWFVVSGVAEVEINGIIDILEPGQTIHVPQGIKHRLTNNKDFPLEIIEIQFGNHLEENDIIRFEDIYGRELNYENAC